MWVIKLMVVSISIKLGPLNVEEKIVDKNVK